MLYHRSGSDSDDLPKVQWGAEIEEVEITLY